MPLHRLLLDMPPPTEGQVLLTGEHAHYLYRVLRLRPGDRFVAAFGAGGEAVATLLEASPDRVTAAVGQLRPVACETGAAVTLLVGLPKGQKLDLVIEKATELGVHTILPVVCLRSVPRPGAERLTGRLERWRRIARSAATQSGRTEPPGIERPVPLAEALRRSAEHDVSVAFGWEGEGLSAVPLAAALSGAPERVALLVGPEGGLAPEELQAAAAAGWRLVSLGPRTLRCETAAIVASALVLYVLGELG